MLPRAEAVLGPWKHLAPRDLRKHPPGCRTAGSLARLSAALHHPPDTSEAATSPAKSAPQHKLKRARSLLQDCLCAMRHPTPPSSLA